MNEPERFDFAKNLIIEAGDLALQYFASVNELSIMSKGAHDMVSEADIAVEELIRNRLMTAYPSDGYLGRKRDTRKPLTIPESGSSIRSTARNPSSAVCAAGACRSPTSGRMRLSSVWSTIRQRVSCSLAAPDEWLNSMGSRFSAPPGLGGRWPHLPWL